MDERQEDCWECGSDNARLFSIDTLAKPPTHGHIMECFDCDFKDIYLQLGEAEVSVDLHSPLARKSGDGAVILADYSNGKENWRQT